jgi:hypothetical protein
MNAILFQLTKLPENQTDKQRKWQAAAYEISKSDTDIPANTGNMFCFHEGCILILDGSASPALAKAIISAEQRQLSYTITFFEKATTWNYDPPSTPPARV